MPIYRTWMALLGLTLAVLAGFAHAGDRPEVADKVVAYAGEQNIKVWTLRIGARSEHQALVQLEGVDHDWDMKIQKMAVEKTDKDTRYVTTVDGKRFVALIVRNGWGELTLPGESQTINVSYDGYLSEQGNAQAFLTDYLQAQ